MKRLFCTVRTIRSYKDDTLSISMKWIHFSLDSSSENLRRNTTREILFSNYDKDVRPNQGGSYIRVVHQDYKRLNVLLKLFYMFPCNDCPSKYFACCILNVNRPMQYEAGVKWLFQPPIIWSCHRWENSREEVEKGTLRKIFNGHPMARPETLGKTRGL